jgi:C4-dicarboxylate-specific signal transduction histidine kinase
MNAIDAVGERPAPDRSIVVHTQRCGEGSMIIAVRDSGLGLAPGTEEHIFQPLFTTKSVAMGMGLAVARSIIEAHNGRIWAANNTDVGATFFVSLGLAAASD